MTLIISPHTLPHTDAEVHDMNKAVMKNFFNRAVKVAPAIDQKKFRADLEHWYETLPPKEKCLHVSFVRGMDKQSVAATANAMFKLFQKREVENG